MEHPIRILHLEDDPLDSELACNLLRREGLPVEVDRVETLNDFREKLGRDDYALILSDFSLPGVDPEETLRLARTLRPELPLIFLSGTIAEDTAIEMLKLGASDYVFKQRLARLAPAVRRALQESAEQTRRKRAEAALKESEARLKESEERFREAFAHAPVGMAITDIGGRFLHVNAAYCRMVGYTETELLQPGYRFQMLTHADDLEQNMRVWQRLLAGEIPAFFYEKRYRRKDGTIIWVRASVTVRRDEHGEPCQVVAIIEDINDRKRAEEGLKSAKDAAEKANRTKSEFLANMSHELRTPMTVIMGYTEFLLNSDRSAGQTEALQAIDTAAHRLLGIIDDLLDITRIEARRLKIEPRPFDQRECLRKAVEMFAIQAREKGLELEWQVDPSLPQTVVGDPERIAQVLVNLIGNAVKFTRCGKVEVSLAAQETGELFTVRDTGIGVPAEKMASLFEPFMQVDGSLTRRFGGVGLGLAICRELVELMGGKIWAASEEGRGSTFRVFLPLPAEAAGPASEAAPAGQVTVGRLPSILLAEDDPMVRELIEMLLRRCNWHVIAAENGREAVERWQAENVDLILMDMQMPVLDGLDATREIRHREEAEKGGHTPIVALTAHARQEDRRECLAAGMDGFLSKPIKLAELRTVVADCLAGNCRPDGGSNDPLYRGASPNI